MRFLLLPRPLSFCPRQVLRVPTPTTATTTKKNTRPQPQVGEFGIIHPEVLAAFDIVNPGGCSCMGAQGGLGGVQR